MCSRPKCAADDGHSSEIRDSRGRLGKTASSGVARAQRPFALRYFTFGRSPFRQKKLCDVQSIGRTNTKECFYCLICFCGPASSKSWLTCGAGSEGAPSGWLEKRAAMMLADRRTSVWSDQLVLQWRYWVIRYSMCIFASEQPLVPEEAAFDAMRSVPKPNNEYSATSACSATKRHQKYDFFRVADWFVDGKQSNATCIASGHMTWRFRAASESGDKLQSRCSKQRPSSARKHPSLLCRLGAREVDAVFPLTTKSPGMDPNVLHFGHFQAEAKAHRLSDFPARSNRCHLCASYEWLASRPLQLAVAKRKRRVAAKRKRRAAAKTDVALQAPLSKPFCLSLLALTEKNVICMMGWVHFFIFCFTRPPSDRVHLPSIEVT
jgi:hypothetical protein